MSTTYRTKHHMTLWTASKVLHEYTLMDRQIDHPCMILSLLWLYTAAIFWFPHLFCFMVMGWRWWWWSLSCAVKWCEGLLLLPATLFSLLTKHCSRRVTGCTANADFIIDVETNKQIYWHRLVTTVLWTTFQTELQEVSAVLNSTVA